MITATASIASLIWHVLIFLPVLAAIKVHIPASFLLLSVDLIVLRLLLFWRVVVEDLFGLLFRLDHRLNLLDDAFIDVSHGASLFLAHIQVDFLGTLLISLGSPLKQAFGIELAQNLRNTGA